MTADHAIQLTDSPAPGDLEDLKKAVVVFNSQAHAYERIRPVACFQRDHNSTLIAGASGYTWWGWLAVEYLWVTEELRRSGLGAAMLRAVEEEARERGRHGAWLDTFSFQARPFYERQGYVQFGELGHFPMGGLRHFLWKRL